MQVALMLFRPEDERILGLKDAAEARKLFEVRRASSGGFVAPEIHAQRYLSKPPSYIGAKLRGNALLAFSEASIMLFPLRSCPLPRLFLASPLPARTPRRSCSRSSPA